MVYMKRVFDFLVCMEVLDSYQVDTKRWIIQTLHGFLNSQTIN
ncbi:hypothetical protein LEP1GSC125_0074 [Leptospira mayottensis 200901122]|uniref:Uncharacterized protein n=1 Tax=Leptospira mayottensis 200901122 TaxID=1193010 RepID=A0AA87MQE8_9LEPT|nr:hypothetical protein LEP1GSC125_0074 [Leptospira mayottensis 200901122]